MRESSLEIADEFDERHTCPKCGNDLEWVECWQIDCEDGMYDSYDEDPINNSPGDMELCSTCDGNGGWLVCTACEKQADSASGEPK